MILSSVDLPIPLGPTMAKRSPRSTRRSTSRNTSLSPNALQTPLTRTTSRPLGRRCSKWKVG